MPPLLHVLGGSPWQIPTVRLAKSMGYRVLVTDYFQDRPAYAYADFHEVVGHHGPRGHTGRGTALLG